MADIDIDAIVREVEARRSTHIGEVLSGLSAVQRAGLAAIPSWTNALATATGVFAPGALAALADAGIVRVGQALELRGTDGVAVEESTAVYTLAPDAVGGMLATLPDSELSALIRNICGTLLTVAVPLPDAAWRAATVGSLGWPGELGERVGVALAASRPDEALAWVRAARTLALALGARAQQALLLATELAGRSVDLFLRRIDDRARDAFFVPPADALAVVNAFIDAPHGPWGLHVLGAGGVGKTMLLRHVLLERTDHLVARLDFDFLNPAFPRREPWLLLSAIVEELRLQAGTAFAVEGWGRVAKGIDRLREVQESEGGEDPFAHPLFQDLVNQLDAAVGGRRVLILLDTCEELERLGGEQEGSEAVEATFTIVERLHDRVPTMRVIFGGRRPLAAAGDGWTAPGCRLRARSWLRAFELFGFSPREARVFIERSWSAAPVQRTPEDRDTCTQAVLRRTRRGRISPRLALPAKGAWHEPYELSLLVAWAAEDATLDPDELATLDRDVYVERRILGRLRDALRRALPGLVACGVFDRTLVRVLCDDEETTETAWREAGRQEWVSGTTGWVTLDPAFRERLARALSSGADWTRLARVARVSLAARLEADPLACDARLVDAWLRSGQSSTDTEFWEALVRRAAGAPDWVDRVTGLVLGPDGALAPRTAARRKVRAAMLLARAAAIARLRPGLTQEWHDLWTRIHAVTAGEVRVRALANASAARLALERIPPNAYVDRLVLELGRAEPRAVAALLSFVDAAAERGARGTWVATPPVLAAFCARVADDPGAPLRAEAAVLAVRLSPPEARRELVTRWRGLWPGTAPEGIDWPGPRDPIERLARLAVELGVALWPAAMGPVETLELVLRWFPQHFALGPAGEDTHAVAALVVRLAAASGRVPASGFPLDQTPVPRRAASRSEPPLTLSMTLESAAAGRHVDAIARCEDWIRSTMKISDGGGQYAGERTLAHVLMLARPPSWSGWRFPYLANSRIPEDRLDAAAAARLVGGEEALRGIEGPRLPSVEDVDVRWRGGTLWPDATDPVDRLDELVGPLDPAIRAAVAMSHAAPLWVSGGDPVATLHLELDLVELSEVLRELGLDAPRVEAEDLSERCRGPADPVASLLLTARAAVLLDGEVPAWQIERLGERRAAGLLLMEGERLAVRVPSAGCRMLRWARDLFVRAGDPLGALRATILAELAWRRAAEHLRPEAEPDAVVGAWERAAAAPRVTAWPALLAFVFTPPPEPSIPPWGTDAPEWRGWRTRARLAADLPGEPQSDSPETARPPRRLSPAATKHVVSTIYAGFAAHPEAAGSPAWLRAWLASASATSPWADISPRPRRRRLLPSTAPDGDVAFRPEAWGLLEGTDAELDFRFHTDANDDLDADADVDATPRWRSAPADPDRILLRRAPGSPSTHEDPTGEHSEFILSLLRDGHADRIESRIREEWPAILRDAGVQPTMIDVDAGSAGVAWEALFEGPIKRVALGRAARKVSAGAGTLVIADSPLHMRLGASLWAPAEVAVAAWGGTGKPATLHVFTGAVATGSGIFLTSDAPSYAEQRGATTLVAPEKLLPLPVIPRFVILQASTHLADAGPDPVSGLLRAVAPALVGLGVGAVLVLPPLDAELVATLGPWDDALSSRVAELRARLPNHLAAHVSLTTTN